MGLSKAGLIVGLFGFLLLDSFVLCMAGVHHYDFVLKNAEFTRLCKTKSMLSVNGEFPGPTIRARVGDTIYVNVDNQGDYGVTIHWHGVKQPRNPWSDGPEFITQCPIQPGTSFTYEVILSDEIGTIWWHAHSDYTRATIYGAIVISPALGTTYPFPKPDAEETIVIGSWFNGDVKAILEEATATGLAPKNSDGYTINGQPGDQYPCSKDDTFRLKFEYGKTYLLRLVNAVMNEGKFFGIAGHKLTVVGQDGAYVKPVTTNYIMIASGQTMDILVKADRFRGFYYMASTPYIDGDEVPFDNTTTTAIVQYKGTIVPPSSIPFPTLPSFDDEEAAERFTSRLRSLASKDHPINVPKRIRRRLYVTVSLNVLPCTEPACNPLKIRGAGSMNNISFVMPPIDILQAYYEGIEGIYETDFPTRPPKFFNFTGNLTEFNPTPTRGTKVKMLNYGEAVEIVFQGTNLMEAMNHPMHLHGFSFFLVGQGKGNFNKSCDPKSYNLVDPPLINTVTLPKSGWVALRFTADNPGVWFIHCHFERHAAWGMDTVLIVKDGEEEDQKMLPPPANMPTCSHSHISKSASDGDIIASQA